MQLESNYINVCKVYNRISRTAVQEFIFIWAGMFPQTFMDLCEQWSEDVENHEAKKMMKTIYGRLDRGVCVYFLLFDQIKSIQGPWS